MGNKAKRSILERSLASLRDGDGIICTERAYRNLAGRISILRSSGRCPSLTIKRTGGLVSIRRKL